MDQEKTLSVWVPLAEVARPHGVRGEVRLKLYNADSDLLLELDEVLLRLPNGEEFEVSVDAARRADQAILVKLHSVDDRDRADAIRGALVCARREDFPAADDDEFYAADVIGAEAWLRASPAKGAEVLGSGASPGRDEQDRVVGTVLDYRSYPSVDIFEVKTTDGITYEVPVVASYVDRVDAAAKRVYFLTFDELEGTGAKKPKPAPGPRPERRWEKKKREAESVTAGDSASPKTE